MPTQNRSARGKNVTKKPGKSKATESSQGIELRAGGGLHGPEKPRRVLVARKSSPET